MAIESSASRRKSLKLHKLILGASLAAAAFGSPRALAQVVLDQASTVNATDQVTDSALNNFTVAPGAGGTQGSSIDLGSQIMTFGAAGRNLTVGNIPSIIGTGTIVSAGAGNTITSALANTGLVTFGGTITNLTTTAGTGTGDVTINAGATLNLQVAQGGANVTYTVTGTLNTTGGGTLEDTSDVNVTATGTYTIGTADTIEDLTSAAGSTITVGAATVFGGANNTTIAGAVAGAGQLTKQGTGTVTISGNNAAAGPGAGYTGNVVINAGTLAISDALALGNAGGGNVTIGANGTLDIQGGISVAQKADNTSLSGTISSTSGTNAYDDDIALAGAATSFNVSSGAVLDITSVISGANPLNKDGAGILEVSGTATYTGATNINTGTLRLGANGALNSTSTINLNGGTFDLNGFSYNGTQSLASGATISGGTLSGAVSTTGGTISGTTLTGNLTTSGTTTLRNVAGSAQATMRAGSTTVLEGSNTLGVVDLQGGSKIQMAVPTNGSTPLSVTSISSGGGTLELDASTSTQAQLEGDKTLVSGSVDDSVAANTTFTFDGVTEQFEGFDKPLQGTGLYDVQLKKGSIILSIQRKGANDICGVTGLCATGQGQGKLEGLDRSEVRSLYGKVVLPALNSGKLDLPFWTTKTQMSKYLISGLMPRNVDAAGTVLSSYNDRMADTLFERLPLRQFEPVEVIEEEIVIEEVETEEPVRGLWKTTAEGEVLEVNGETYQEDTSLTAQYTKRDGMRAWVRGFGGDVAAAQTTKYLYKDYNATNAGGVVGVDYAAFDDFQVGVYANYGDLAINTDSNKYAGSGSWNPTGWGGGITADYWTDSYYVQGLFGASAFSGDQDRSIVAIGGDLGGGNTLSGNKNVTSFVGALRAGAPMQVGSFYLEPQAQATWSGNQEDAFNEGGNSNFKLKYKSRQTNFLQTELGIKVAYPIALGSTQQLVPSVRVAWLGDWNMNNEGQKIGYRFSNKSIDLDSYQKDQNGALLEGGLDYTVANIGATSFKVYGRGGAEVWDTERGTNWRASGGVTLQF